MNLGEVMRQRALDPHDLENLTGVAAPNIYAMKSGSRIMGPKTAAKLGQALNMDPDVLRVGNLSSAMKQAMKRGDPHGVLTAARSIVEIAEKRTITPESERFLDELVQGAVKFAENTHLFELESEEIEVNVEEPAHASVLTVS